MQNGLRCGAHLSVCVLVTILLGQVAVADFSGLLQQVPASANTLLILNSNAVQAKATSNVEQEIRRFLDSANAWPIVAPWKPERIVIASEMDIHHMAPEWEMAAMDFQQTLDVEELAKRANGVTDKLLGHDVIWLENACILIMGPKQLTMVSPLNRQSAARWLQRVGRAKESRLSNYLAEKSAVAVRGSAEITFMMELQNVFSPAQVGKAIAGSRLFQKIKPDPTQLLCGVRGLVIACQVGPDKDSSMVIDFSESTESLKPIVKPMMMNALVKAGAMLDEFHNWVVTAEGDQISMNGKLSPLDIRRVMSLSSLNSSAGLTSGMQSGDQPLTVPSKLPADQSTPPLTGTQKRNEQTAVRRATKRYFQNVTDSIDSITRNTRRPNLENAALWINNEARKIDRLSTKNVDLQMLEYGKWVSESMKNVVYIYHQSDNQINSEMSSTTPVIGETTFGRAPVYRGYNWGGGYRYSYAPFYSQKLNIGQAAQDRRAVVDRNVGSANSSAMQVFQNIARATDEIRDAMSKKYNDQF